jgi:hypothetical protein
VQCGEGLSRLAVPFAFFEHGGVEIVIARDAGKVLARMQPAKAKDIREAIDKVAADPTAPNNNLRALKGVPNGFRIRVGASLRSNWYEIFVLPMKNK